MVHTHKSSEMPRKTHYRMDVLGVGSMMSTSACTICWESHTMHHKRIMFPMYKYGNGCAEKPSISPASLRESEL